MPGAAGKTLRGTVGRRPPPLGRGVDFRRGGPVRLAAPSRTGGRAVECTGLENRQSRKWLVGSNPTPSAWVGCLRMAGVNGFEPGIPGGQALPLKTGVLRERQKELVAP